MYDPARFASIGGLTLEGEIDLRPYIQLLLRRWLWIVGAAVLAALVALAVTAFATPVFEATSLVVITEPRQIVEFDPRFRATDESQPLSAFPELATSDELLESLLVQMESSHNVSSLEELRGLLEARPGGDPSLIRLSVRHQEPRVAAEIANAWAELFVIRANQIYGNQGEAQARFFESQLERTENELQAAEAALVAFQSLNRTEIISNTLSFYNQSQVDYLAAQRTLSSLAQDVQTLRNQLAEQPANTEVSLAGQLASLSLQLQVLNVQFQGETAAPLQFQINGLESFQGASSSEQLAFLDNLREILEAKLAQVALSLDELEPEILELQAQRQELEAESARLILNRTVAEETYLTLARKVDEERILAQDSSRGVRLASHATMPVNPVGPRAVPFIFVAGAIGLVLAIFVVFAVDWWYTPVLDDEQLEKRGIASESPATIT